MKDARHPLAIRVRPEVLEQIDGRATKAGMSRNAYIIQSALGTLEERASDIQERFEEIETRLDHLERWQQLSE